MSLLAEFLVTHPEAALRFSNDIFEKVFQRNFHKHDLALRFFHQRGDAIVFDPSDNDLSRANI